MNRAPSRRGATGAFGNIAAMANAIFRARLIPRVWPMSGRRNATFFAGAGVRWKIFGRSTPGSSAEKSVAANQNRRLLPICKQSIARQARPERVDSTNRPYTIYQARFVSVSRARERFQLQTRQHLVLACLGPVSAQR